MPGDSCLDHYPPLGEVPNGMIAYLISIVILIPIRIYLAYTGSFEAPPRLTSPAYASYGVSALSLMIFLTGIGLAENFPNFVLWFIFRNSPGPNAAEFACQCQNSYIGGIFGVYLAFLVLLILHSNQRRMKNRDVFTSEVKQYLIPCEGGHRPQFVVLPCLRGMWVPPLVKAFRNNVASDSLDVYCCDTYLSKVNPEASAWMISNMKFEKIDQFIQLYEKLDYSALPFRDSSVDALVMPTGNLNTNFTQIDDNDERTEAYRKYFQEVHRVLRPGGNFIATVTVYLFSHPLFDKEFTNDFEVIPSSGTWLWNTIVPSVVYILRKKPQSSPDADNENGNVLAWKNQADFIDIGNIDMLTHNATSSVMSDPWSKQLLVTYVLTALMIALWIIAVVLTWYFMVPLEVPSYLPYGSKLLSVLISNWTSLPIVMYFLTFKMYSAAEILPRTEQAELLGEGDVRDTTAVVNARTSGTSKRQSLATKNLSTTSDSFRYQEAVEEELATRRVLRSFSSGMLEVLLLLTFISFISWLPYFVLDLILFHQGYSAFELQNVNQYVSYGVVAFVVMIVRPALKWYMDYKKRQATAEAAAEVTDLDQVAERASLAAVPGGVELHSTHSHPSLRAGSFSEPHEGTKNPVNSSFVM